MKAVAFNGSPRKDGNTAILLRHVLDGLSAEGIETEFIQLGGKRIRGCQSCFKCFKKQDGKCSIDEDFTNECIEKMSEADVIILGSPTYFANVSAEMKALIDRAGMVGMANGGLYKRKLGAAVVAVRRGGQVTTFDAINHFFLINEMIVPGSSYWNHGIGREPGDVENDEEGIQTMSRLAANIAWLLKKIIQ